MHCRLHPRCGHSLRVARAHGHLPATLSDLAAGGILQTHLHLLAQPRQRLPAGHAVRHALDSHILYPPPQPFEHLRCTATVVSEKGGMLAERAGAWTAWSK